jgi:lipopolysaccharide export system permease protein
MLFRKIVSRELAMVAAGVFVILLTILLSTQSVNMLGRAARGRVASEAVLGLVGFWSVGFYPVLLILTIFITVLVVMSRYWRDHEMAIWLSSGLSLKQWIRPVLSFALPLAVLVAIGSLVLSSWASLRAKEYAEVLKQREDLSIISPGVFKEDKKGRVYFIEKFDVATGDALSVFYQTQNKDGTPIYITAQSGRMVRTPDDKIFFSLSQGHRYEGLAGTPLFKVGSFAQYNLEMDAPAAKLVNISNSDVKTSLQLLQSDDTHDTAELAWRISMPLTAIIVALLGIPLSYYNSRSGTVYNLLAALGVYLLYQNSLWLGRDGIAAGHLPNTWLSILPVHAMMLALAVGLFYYRGQPSGFWQRKKP